MGALLLCGVAPALADGSAPPGMASGAAPAPVPAQPVQLTLPSIPTDQAIMIQAAQRASDRGDPEPAQQALPALRGTLLEPWVAYWAIKPTLSKATQQDFEAFARAYPNTYVLDRLRNDWLLELGKRQDWADFDAVYPQFIMRDDPQVQCYDLQARYETKGENTSAEVLRIWMDVRNGGDGCNSAAGALLAGGAMSRDMLWTRLRRFYSDGRARVGRDLLAPYLPPGTWRILAETDRDTVHYLLGVVRQGARGAAADPQRRQFVMLALLDLARQDPEQAARLMRDAFGSLPAQDRAQIWGRIGLWGALNQMPQAADWYAQADRADPDYVADVEVRQWAVRAALLAQDWPLVRRATKALIDSGETDDDWAYWHAQALQHLGQGDRARGELQTIASPWSYYGQLALEALGERIAIPPSMQPASDVAMARMSADVGLQRSLALFNVNLRNEAVRQWNFTLRKFDNAQMQAAAALACSQQIWDRCINTSERVSGGVDWQQRYVMPYRTAIARASQTEGVDEAFLFGLIRQESRFVADIQSWAGASGLMQLMPATARLVARKIGLDSYSRDQITDVDTNVMLGSAYVGGLLQQFDGSEALAAAGYNAGPGRSRRWRNMGPPGRPVLPGAVFVENIPIGETRNYVKAVLSNSAVYAALLGVPGQSLVARLGDVGPAPTQEARAP